MIRHTVLLALSALAAGCIDTQLHNLNDDENPVDTDDDTGIDTNIDTDTDVVLPLCEERSFPGYATDRNVDCENEVEVGTFTPVALDSWPMENIAMTS